MVGYSSWSTGCFYCPKLVSKRLGRCWVVLLCVHAKLLQSCPSLCYSVDCSPPGSSVYGIVQARILKWVALPSSRGSSWPKDWTCVSYVSGIGRQVLYHYTTWDAQSYFGTFSKTIGEGMEMEKWLICVFSFWIMKWF